MLNAARRAAEYSADAAGDAAEFSTAVQAACRDLNACGLLGQCDRGRDLDGIAPLAFAAEAEVAQERFALLV